MTKTKALLLAGGLGTRLRPVTDTVPKCLVPIAGRPLLDYWFDALGPAGATEVRINTHHLPDAVRRYIAQKNVEGQFHLTESYEPKLLGSAGTIHANRDFADDATDVLIIYADNLSNVDLAAMLAFHHEHGDPMTMLLFHHPLPKQAGIVELDDASRVISFVEKPAEPKSDLANAGIYAVTAEAYREMADMNAFDLGFDVLPKFVGRMRGYTFDGYHRDIGTLGALAAAEADAPRVFGCQSEVER
ncbi:MAG: NTP transferase domain-containing protein [Planctomycetes bacterium]|nr:NTP transferase domain-containing protein [Planctomycetota bacterium]